MGKSAMRPAGVHRSMAAFSLNATFLLPSTAHWYRRENKSDGSQTSNCGRAATYFNSSGLLSAIVSWLTADSPCQGIRGVALWLGGA
ncbi:hypothetical protein B0T24DRAFT_620127 [Lasiosphaeria ovina]|uniref:Uncharacterized protein n=1 Tax=Lasiosphaeria ovina TaxID=92902 RepID=A0AAE0NB90_9PEZI|nr:hypothetical protein B0T24DRAFT_620127 [Lasiosphaeria ovina]